MCLWTSLSTMLSTRSKTLAATSRRVCSIETGATVGAVRAGLISGMGGVNNERGDNGASTASAGCSG